MFVIIQPASRFEWRFGMKVPWSKTFAESYLFTTNKATAFFLELILTISQPEKMSKNVKLCQILKKLNMQNYTKF